MSSKLIAGNATNGSSLSADTTGILEIQTGSTSTTAITVDASQNVTLNNVIPSGSTVPSNGMFLPTTNSVGFSTASTERMRIDSSGNLLVGTTNTDPITNGVNGVVINQSGFVLRTPTNTNKWGLDATSGNHIRFFTSGNTAAGIISSNGATTTYGTGSDYRMKENIAPMTGALDTVAKLKPVTYTWKPEFAGTKSSGQGFIAHELQAVVPDCVTGEKDAVNEDGTPNYQGIDTSFLVATLTAAIQELNAKVDAQAAEIKALKGVA
jgi:hypothetical protein